MPDVGPASHSLSEYLAIARRRFWWIFLSLFICWAAVWGASWLIPATYQSEALILVEQQKVPENYVASNVSVDLQDRLQSMTQQILSRTRLQTTIDRFHLYNRRPEVLRLTQAEDPIEQMRKDIKIDLVRSSDHPGQLTAFKIQYSASSAELAQQVNNELTSLFIDENLKDQQQQSESTTTFLDSQLTEARANLEQQEAKVRAFKMAHFANLPSQMQSNIQILSGLQGQLQTTQRDLDSAKQQKLYLDSLLQEYNSQRASVDSTGNVVMSPDELDKELLGLRVRLADARAKYTEDYPDVVALKDRIAKIEKLKQQTEAEVQANEKTAKPAADSDSPAQQTSSASTMQIQSQLKANQLEIQNYQKQLADINGKISEYQSRLNLTPEVEQELAEVSRGYEETMANYNSLLQKQMQSQLATSLEQRQQGEQFRILDPPSLPQRPSSPRHLLWSLAGLALGAAIGVGLAALFELTQVRVRQAQDIQSVARLPMLVAIPRLTTRREDRLRPVLSCMRASVVAAMIIVILAGNLYDLYKG
jgi:polysaccharide biosynthesis transport protein